MTRICYVHGGYYSNFSRPTQTQRLQITVRIPPDLTCFALIGGLEKGELFFRSFPFTCNPSTSPSPGQRVLPSSPELGVQQSFEIHLRPI